MGKDKTRLSEFVVTPSIARSVEVLRAAIPRRGDIPPGGEGITVIREPNGSFSAESFRVVDDFHGTMERDDFALTEELRQAAATLIAAITHQYQLIEQAYEYPDEEAIRAYASAAVKPGTEVPDGYLKACDDLAEDVRRKLNISFGIIDSHKDSVTVES
jgi:hypothetical protein